MSVDDRLGPLFAALADPTRREMVAAMVRDGSTSVPALSSTLPITRQAIAKHLTTLHDAGLLDRAPSAGREVRYSLRAGALDPALAWLGETDRAWEARLVRLKGSVERGVE
ncbi:MAG TPA: metalloregulator ArsR/SmtB family transcription factor [Solirubrobacteraceae bacterium]